MYVCVWAQSEKRALATGFSFNTKGCEVSACRSAPAVSKCVSLTKQRLSNLMAVLKKWRGRDKTVTGRRLHLVALDAAATLSSGTKGTWLQTSLMFRVSVQRSSGGRQKQRTVVGHRDSGSSKWQGQWQVAKSGGKRQGQGKVAGPVASDKESCEWREQWQATGTVANDRSRGDGPWQVTGTVASDRNSGKVTVAAARALASDRKSGKWQKQWQSDSSRSDEPWQVTERVASDRNSGRVAVAAVTSPGKWQKQWQVTETVAKWQ